MSLARHGANVVVNDIGGNIDGSGRDTSLTEQVVREIRDFGGTAIANSDDVSS